MANVLTSQVDATLAPQSYAQGQTGYTYITNGIDPASVRLAPTNNTRLWGVPAVASAPTLGAPAADANGLTGTYYWYVTYYNADSGFRGSPSPISASATLTAQKVTLTFTDTVPSGYGITHRSVFRNTAGQTNVFYHVADIVTGTGTFTDGDSTDESDVAIQSSPTLLDEDASLPPQHCPFVKEHNGRLHLFGSREESVGTIAGSATFTTITGTGTNFRASHVGQYLYVSTAHATRYTITAVASATSLTVTPAISSNITAGSSFWIRHPTPSRWYWSLPGKIEAFPFANAADVFPSDGEDPTGLFTCNGTLYAAKDTKVYRLAYQKNPSPDADGSIFPALHKRGLINQRCAIEMGSEVYLLDRLGIYLFNGSAVVQNIDFAIRTLIQPSAEPSADRLNFTYAYKWHGCWEPIRDRLVWFVTTGSDTEPKTALVFDRTLQQWSLEDFPMGITASTLQLDGGGQLRMLVADENGQRWFFASRTAMDCSPPEASSTVRGTVTSSTSTTLTDSGASFYNSGQELIGCPVTVFHANGDVETRIVSSNTGTQLTVSSAWTTTPTTTATYIVGAIETQLTTPWYDLGDPSQRAIIGDATVLFAPSSETTAWAGVTAYYDLSDDAFTDYQCRDDSDGASVPATAIEDGELRVNLSYEKGVARIPLGKKAAHFARLKYRMIDAARNIPLLGFTINSQPEQRLGREAV